MTKSSIEIPNEDTQSTEDEGAHKSFGKGDQADSKSIDSPRSTEEEDDDEVFCLYPFDIMMMIYFSFGDTFLLEYYFLYALNLSLEFK